jgi:hypothetical protein
MATVKVIQSEMGVAGSIEIMRREFLRIGSNAIFSKRQAAHFVLVMRRLRLTGFES